MRTSYSYAGKDYPGMETCLGSFNAETELDFRLDLYWQEERRMLEAKTVWAQATLAVERPPTADRP